MQFADSENLNIYVVRTASPDLFTVSLYSEDNVASYYFVAYKTFASVFAVELVPFLVLY